MLLLYTYVAGCIKAFEALDKEGYEYENFQTVCKTKQEAIERLENHIKSNKKLNKNATFYIYISNAYEFNQYWDDTHFVFDYSLGDIKVIEGKVVPEDPFDDEDYWFIEYKENLNSEWIYDYEPMPEDLRAELKKRMDMIDENPDYSIKLETPYDHISKADEIENNIVSALDGGEFRPITIQLSDEAVAKYEKHDNAFNKSYRYAMSEYLDNKCKEEKI